MNLQAILHGYWATSSENLNFLFDQVRLHSDCILTVTSLNYKYVAIACLAGIILESEKKKSMIRLIGCAVRFLCCSHASNSISHVEL